MFNGLKTFLTNIGDFFKNLFAGRVSITSSKSLDPIEQRKAERDSLLTNSALSEQPADLYDAYNALSPGGLTSLYNKETEAGLTGQQMAMNEMQMDNQRRQYAFQVQGMQEAGLNPALMYESGAQAAPSAPAASGGMSMSEILQAMLFGKQSKLLDAQARNIDADTDKKNAETENMNLINQYYPEVTDTQIKKIMSEIGLNDEQIKKIESDIDTNILQQDLMQIDKVIKRAEANESSAYFKAVREYQEANTEKVKQEKAELAVRTAMETIEKEFMAHTNTKMGSATIVAIASALGSLIHGFNLDLDGVKSPFDVEAFKKSFKEDFDKIIEWINKPKKAPWVE